MILNKATENVVADVLPYVDREDGHQCVREAVMKPSKNDIKHLELERSNTTVFETELMRSEFDRTQQRLQMKRMNVTCFKLPPQPIVKCIDISVWQDKLENLNAQLELKATRITNLEYITKYGAETWKIYAEILLKHVVDVKTQIADLIKQIQVVNTQQKDMQLQLGEKLRHLQTDCVGLVRKNHEIGLACRYMEKEIVPCNLSKLK